MEGNRFQLATLDLWKTCVPVPFCRQTPPTNDCSWLWQEHTLVRRAFTVFVNNY